MIFVCTCIRGFQKVILARALLKRLRINTLIKLILDVLLEKGPCQPPAAWTEEVVFETPVLS